MSAEELEQDEHLGRLNITTVNGYDAEGDCLDQAYAYGARSFSIYTPGGELVHDSGSDFEDVTAELLGRDGFNANNDESGEDAFDSRSDDKGPEPEGVAVGEAYGNTYAFIATRSSASTAPGGRRALPAATDGRTPGIPHPGSAPARARWPGGPG